MAMTMQHPHGEVTPSVARWFIPDPANNVGRSCDVDHRTALDMAEFHGVPIADRGWSVRGYYGRDECGCPMYHLTHQMLDTGMTATLAKSPDCTVPHVTVTNLY